MSFENIQINVDTLPAVEDIAYLPLEKPFRTIGIIQTIGLFLAASALISFFYFNADKLDKQYFLYALVGLSILFVLRILAVLIGFKYKAFALREKDIAYRSGWLFQSNTLVPFKRVQHCEVTQGPLSRIFGLARLKIFTAGGSQSDISIPGITLGKAKQLKSFILKKLEHGEEE